MTIQTYRLGSSPLVHAPGIIVWARSGYLFPKDRPQLIKIISETWGIPTDATADLLSGKTPYTIEGETVVFAATSGKDH